MTRNITIIVDKVWLNYHEDDVLSFQYPIEWTLEEKESWKERNDDLILMFQNTAKNAMEKMKEEKIFDVDGTEIKS